MATHLDIQTYVAKKYGWTPKSCWIAHVKEISGIIVDPAPNRKGKERANPCPLSKLPAIQEALRNYRMI